ncbi:hypothetical protein NDU88_001860 [Pleurodeles waltl]|uniref:Uncharacterized protein n=1 Tax=Pleurodeles waltl TaxID=8319 RepID=A0AAV7Q5I9_PLEWA|nr:hypothetical protein NDU88_001860 [Pleurodeles waltl]
MVIFEGATVAFEVTVCFSAACFFSEVTMSQRKSGFKPCRECGGKMSVTDPHSDCLWCLSSDHDVATCDSCQHMNPKALKEREAKLFMAKSKRKEKKHHRKSSSPKSHRRHRDSRRRRDSRRHSSKERSRSRSPSASKDLGGQSHSHSTSIDAVAISGFADFAWADIFSG